MPVPYGERGVKMVKIFIKIFVFFIIMALIASLGIMFHKSYQVVILKRGAKCNCKIQGIGADVVVVSGNVYHSKDSVCGGRIVEIHPDRVMVMFNEAKEEYRIGEVIERFNKISLGMSKERIRGFLGEPTLIKEARYDKEGRKVEVNEYSETIKEGWEKKYRLYFTDDKLVKIRGAEGAF